MANKIVDRWREPSLRGDGYWLVHLIEYDHTSVLEGQQDRSLQRSFNTLEEAVQAYPNLEVLDHSTADWPKPVVPNTPAPWFDPLNAGERWDDDY